MMTSISWGMAVLLKREGKKLEPLLDDLAVDIFKVLDKPKSAPGSA